jgi:hypothetical membrane protein
MGSVNRNRLRYGALAWLLTLQFFVVETVAQLQWPVPYSRADQVISDLGTALSPAATLMNASFVVQGLLIGAGALVLRPALRGLAARIAPVLLGLAGIGALLVGFFPSDGIGVVHGIGAVLHLVGGGIGLIALAYGVRPRSEVLGTTLALLGLIGTAGTIFFLTGVTDLLGSGGTERLAAYPIPIGLALAGLALWRLGPGTGPGEAPGPTRRELKEQERAARAEQDRLRDEALEAAVQRQAAVSPPEEAASPREQAASVAVPDDDGEDADDIDPEDPWAPPVRRRER